MRPTERGEGEGTPSPLPSPPLARGRGKANPLAPRSGERVANAARRVRGRRSWPRPCVPRSGERVASAASRVRGHEVPAPTVRPVEQGERKAPPHPYPLPRRCGGEGKQPHLAPTGAGAREANPLAPRSGERVASAASRVRGQRCRPRPCVLESGDKGRHPLTLTLSPAGAGAREANPTSAPLVRGRGKANPLAPRSGERVANAASRVRGRRSWPRPCVPRSGEREKAPPHPYPLPRWRGGEGASAEMYRPASRVRGQRYWPQPPR